MDMVLAAWIAVRTRGVRTRAVRDERGDVPGWVMIVVMTAGLVAVITAVAAPQPAHHARHRAGQRLRLIAGATL